MVKYTVLPQTKFTIGEEEFINNRLLAMSIINRESAFQTGTLTLKENLADLWPDIVTNNTPVKVEVKADDEGSWTNMFEGVCRFPVLPLELKETLMLKCDGLGYGFGDNLVAQEYGLQSINPTLYKLQTILSNLSKGIIPAWVNKYMETSNPTGFNYNTTKIEDVPGEVPFIAFFNKANKCLEDLLDLATALQNGSAGPHWLVTPGVSPDNNKYFRLKTIGADQDGWTNYYGGNQATATLQEGNDRDFQEGHFEPIGKEANVIYYLGAWRRPSNGDVWTNPGAAASWECLHASGGVGDDELTDDTTNYLVNNGSLKCRNLSVVLAQNAFWYPAGRNAAWDFSSFTDFNTPFLNFYFRRSADISLTRVMLHTMINPTTTQGSFYKFIHDDLADAGEFYHFAFPVGPYAQKAKDGWKWSIDGTPDWSKIDNIYFSWNGGQNVYVNVDGLHFGGAAVLRVAREKWPSEGGTMGYIDPATGICANPVRSHVITDNMGKDDSLNAADDTGLMAQLAKAALLRMRKPAITGYFQTPLIKDLMPGQFLHIHAKPTKMANTYQINKDMRCTQVIQNISAEPMICGSVISVTDDLTNSRARLLYNDQNKMYEAIRTGFQDRQATSITLGDIDIRMINARLEKAY